MNYELSRRDEAEKAQCERDIARVQGMITELRGMAYIDAGAAIDWLKDAIGEAEDHIASIECGALYRGDRANVAYENARAA
ncbi:hypothetical protein [Kozakia baliensis]|uniref:hypothetical protein n=1 Tax=Kozakia baliensis TaxID=153496 RepID=UPI0004970EA0|nr:hypothetical protein [Kozakia baliensis]